MKRTRIGIYGGAFNPIHFGHLRTARDVISKLSLEKVIFIPAGTPPFNKPGLADAGHRFNMVEASIQGHFGLEVSDAELHGSGKSYTIDTVEKLSKEGAELFLITGIDAFKDIQLWKEPERLLSIVNIAVISRPGYLFAGLSSSPYLGGVPEEVLKMLDRGEREAFTFDSPGIMGITLCKVVDADISSSYVRKIISQGKDTRHLLPESVKSYIISHNLYTKNIDQE